MVSTENAPQDNHGNSTTALPPWRRVATSMVHSTPWFAVWQDDVMRPDGSAGVYGRVDSPGAVTVLPLEEDDTVVITRQWMYLHAETQWRLPGGAIDSTDVNPLAAAQRELAEETGLRARNWRPIGKINCADSLTNHVVHMFVATGLTQGEADLELGESDLEVVRLPLRRVISMAMSNDVPDAGSAHAIVRYAAQRAGIGAQ